MPTVVYVVCSASPVMIPGSAIGQDHERTRWSRGRRSVAGHRERSSVPSTSATTVAPIAAWSESQSASRTSGSFHAAENHLVEKLSIGQRWVTLSLKA